MLKREVEQCVTAAQLQLLADIRAVLFYGAHRNEKLTFCALNG